MFRFIFGLCATALISVASIAQPLDPLAADHDALRKLKADITSAVNQRDYAAVQKVMHSPFMATLNTQDSFTDIDKLKHFYDGLYSREFLRLKNVVISAEADDLSQVYQGTFAVNKGSTKERYELADGRVFDMNGRWTAVSIKENGGWKILAVHMGTNFLDNPVIGAIEKSVIWFTAGGAAGGLLLGLATGWFIWRRRAR